MLEALSPSSIAVSLQMAEDLDLERQQLRSRWTQRLEWAAYATVLARRRSESVDSDSRLVASTLERAWEAALARADAARPPPCLQNENSSREA